MERRDICKVLRKTFESFHEEEDGEFCVWADDLECYCGIASWYLSILFKRYGYNADVIFGQFALKTFLGNWLFDEDICHCWVMSDGKIYDITATQFGLPKVVIASKRSNKWDRYLAVRRYTRTSDFKEMDWGEERPTKKNGRIILSRFDQIAKKMGYI